ncbi:MAG TPA: methyltransferase domain-containing protein [Solirubrobacteraceae bacterium]
MTSADRGQAAVDEYFDTAADYWREVYEADDLQGLVYRQRQETALAWVRELGLPESAQALDAGCGAGLMSVALAGEGLQVTATDSSPQMVALTTQRATAEGLSDRVEVERADAHQLPCASGAFSLVLALGLLPWLSDPAAAVAELTRVLAPGGWLLLTADNERRLNRLVEPKESPLLAPLKEARRGLRQTAGRQPAGAQAYRHRSEDVDGLLRAAGVEPVKRTTVGYGPFTFLSRPALTNRAGTRLHLALEHAAARHPRLRTGGWHYVVLGRHLAA